MHRLDFFTDFERDKIYIKNNFPKLRKLFDMNKLLETYYPSCVNKSDEEIFQFFMENKEIILQQTEHEGKLLESKWKKVENEYFTQIEKITDFKWKNNHYNCHISSSWICGGGYERSDTIIVFPRARHCNAVQTIMHELFHLHFWDFLESIGIELTKEKRKDLWDLSETIDFILEDLKIDGIKYKSSLYAQHRELYEKIKPLWKGDFKEFIINSLEVVKYY
ncbi:MAG: hypothetical protein KJ906_02170 [Nanoarchaeota archaeon]|nr:hypothetical protein [Nanoarchaeota archaeon]